MQFSEAEIREAMRFFNVINEELFSTYWEAAIQALEKQLPKEVVEIYGGDEIVCMGCETSGGISYSRFGKMLDFCANCGQAIRERGHV